MRSVIMSSYFKIKLSGACIAVCFMLSPILQAGTIPWSELPPEAKWSIHIDVEGITRTSLYKKMYATHLEEKMNELAKEFAEKTGLAMPDHGLLSMTVFGDLPKTSLEEKGDDNEMMIMEISPELTTSIRGMLEAAMNKDGDDTDIEIVQIRADQADMFSIEGEIILALDEQTNHLCVGHQREHITKQIERFRNDETSTSGRHLLETFKLPKGTLACFVGKDIFQKSGKLSPQEARILQMTKGAALSMGESDDRFFLDLVLVTDSAETALQVQRIMAGIQAMAVLTVQDPAWFQLIQAFDIRSRQENVLVNWKMPVDDIMKSIDALYKP